MPVAIPVLGWFPHFCWNLLASGLSENSNREIRRRLRKSPLLPNSWQKWAPVIFAADFVSAADAGKKCEWGESVFIARASEHGLPVSEPGGDSHFLPFWDLRSSSSFLSSLRSIFCPQVIEPQDFVRHFPLTR
jgi:hypothetical protein